MDAKTQAEYDRIKAGPNKGYFTFLHHSGPVVEYSKNVMERVNYILSDKDLLEHYIRLRHIYYVPEEMARHHEDALANHYKVCMDARTDHYTVCNDALADHNKACENIGVLDLIPNCTWNRRTIFGERN